MKITVFWVMQPCRLLRPFQRNVQLPPSSTYKICSDMKIETARSYQTTRRHSARDNIFIFFAMRSLDLLRSRMFCCEEESYSSTRLQHACRMIHTLCQLVIMLFDVVLIT